MKHLLIVDDDTRICSLLARLFRRENYYVTYVTHAGDALESAKYFAFDMVITDVMMPDISGYDLTSKIRLGATFFDKNIPIIILSAGWETQNRITGIKEGADDYLVKPFEPDELLVRVAGLFRRYVSQEKPSLPSFVQSGDYRLEQKNLCLYYKNIPTDLTQTETDFLNLIMSYPNVPVSRYEVINKCLLGTDDNPQSRAAEVMIGRLRKKIKNTIGQFPPIVTRRGEGYVWNG